VVAQGTDRYPLASQDDPPPRRRISRSRP
jgi:hypothetical protein